MLIRGLGLSSFKAIIEDQTPAVVETTRGEINVISIDYFNYGLKL